MFNKVLVFCPTCMKAANGAAIALCYISDGCLFLQCLREIQNLTFRNRIGQATNQKEYRMFDDKVTG